MTELLDQDVWNTKLREQEFLALKYESLESESSNVTCVDLYELD